VRARLREWLSSLAWPEPDADDVVMAVKRGVHERGGARVSKRGSRAGCGEVPLCRGR
jgi:hypothetical protein